MVLVIHHIQYVPFSFLRKVKHKINISPHRKRKGGRSYIMKKRARLLRLSQVCIRKHTPQLLILLYIKRTICSSLELCMRIRYIVCFFLRQNIYQFENSGIWCKKSRIINGFLKFMWLFCFFLHVLSSPVQAWIYTPRQASGGCKQNALLYSAGVKREKVHFYPAMSMGVYFCWIKDLISS